MQQPLLARVVLLQCKFEAGSSFFMEPMDRERLSGRSGGRFHSALERAVTLLRPRQNKAASNLSAFFYECIRFCDASREIAEFDTVIRVARATPRSVR